MDRLARIAIVNAPPHVTQRGNARQCILSGDSERLVYLDLLRRYIRLHDLSLLGYCIMFLLLPALVFGQEAARVKQSPTLCKVESLPPDIQNRLKEEYGSWKIQEPADLSQRAHDRWESEKPLECPGIAVGHFESAKTTSYAILLVPTGRADAGYRFLVFSQQADQHSYETRLVDKWDQNGAANYFIHRTPISKFFDEPSRKKFQAHSVDGILLVDSAENEYGIDVYFWSGGRYRHEWIDY